jgi:hypothetical protein
MGVPTAPPTEVTYSGHYLHESACGLQEEGHQIQKRFIEVMREAAARWDGEVDVAAAGCGTCFNSDADGAYFWIAQGDATDTVWVNFDADDRAPFGQHLVDTANDLDVAVAWDGDARTCVLLGDDAL